VAEVAALPPEPPRKPTLPPVNGPAGSAMVAMARMAEGYQAPLVARTHMRLGIWQAALAEVTPLLNPKT
jgi:hypothetical protein